MENLWNLIRRHVLDHLCQAIRDQDDLRIQQSLQELHRIHEAEEILSRYRG